MNFSPAFPAQNAPAEFLSTAWQDIGVTAKLQPLERQAWAPLHRGSEYEGTAVLFASSASIDEALYHYFKRDVSRNVRRNCDPKLDALLDQMRSEGNEAARRVVVSDIQELLAEEQYRIELPQNASASSSSPMCTTSGIALTHGRMEITSSLPGWTSSPEAPYFWNSCPSAVPPSQSVKGSG